MKYKIKFQKFRYLLNTRQDRVESSMRLVYSILGSTTHNITECSLRAETVVSNV